MICQKFWLAKCITQKRSAKTFTAFLVAALLIFALSPAAYAGSGTPMWVKGLFTGAPPLEGGRIDAAPSIELPVTRTLPSVTVGERSLGEVPLWIKKLEVQNVGRASPYYDEVMGLSNR